MKIEEVIAELRKNPNKKFKAKQQLTDSYITMGLYGVVWEDESPYGFSCRMDWEWEEVKQ